MSVKSKHSSKKDKVLKKEKKKKSQDSDEEIESSEEELDLTKECHPIGYYMNDRAEMINQMFSVIKGNKLKAMLPPILKDCDLEQLKLQCLDQLLGMSEKRITCILEGETLDTSSESDVAESDDYDSDEKNGTSSASSSDRSEDSQEDDYSNNLSTKHKKRKAEAVTESKAGKLPKTDPPEQGKTLLEILELEMRARAIRALLKQSGNEKGSEQTDEQKTGRNLNGIDEATEEVVDLTECEDEEPPSLQKPDLEGSDIDKKVLTFEEKIEKSKSEKQNSNQVEEKTKKLQAELGFRNKFFKKKIYRTRQQRMESEEEEKNVEESSNKIEEESKANSDTVLIKQEPVEPDEIVVEDPEEGEVSTSEDEYPVEIKKEVIEPEPQATEGRGVEAEEESDKLASVENKNPNSEAIPPITPPEEEYKEAEKEFKEAEEESKEAEQGFTEAKKEKSETAGKEPEKIEETSWRDRWLQKDGVQKMVKSSKIYAKVKKRIAEKSQKAKEEVPTPYEANSDSNSNSRLEVVEGSIEEYERLLGKNLKESDATDNENSQQSFPTNGGSVAECEQQDEDKAS